MQLLNMADREPHKHILWRKENNTDGESLLQGTVIITRNGRLSSGDSRPSISERHSKMQAVSEAFQAGRSRENSLVFL